MPAALFSIGNGASPACSSVGPLPFPE